MTLLVNSRLRRGVHLLASLSLSVLHALAADAQPEPTRTISLHEFCARADHTVDQSAKATLCSPGTYSSTRYSPCTNCNPGTFSKESGQTSCLAARAGYFVATAAATTETPCHSGTYSASTGSTSCAACPAGYQCPSDALANPQGCSPGRYSTGGAVQCTTCPAGMFNSIQRATSCCDCPAGYFNGQPGNTNCQKCSNQAPYSDPGATGQGSCYSPARRYAISSSATQAPDGTCPSSTLLPSSMARRRVAHPPRCERSGEKPCPVSGVNWRAGPRLRSVPYECVDIAGGLFSCGGCVTDPDDGKLSEDGGRDCSSIPNVDGVGCHDKRCVIESCQPDFVLSDDRQNCVPYWENWGQGGRQLLYKDSSDSEWTWQPGY